MFIRDYNFLVHRLEFAVVENVKPVQYCSKLGFFLKKNLINLAFLKFRVNTE